jgi:hypothetical protein
MIRQKYFDHILCRKKIDTFLTVILTWHFILKHSISKNTTIGIVKSESLVMGSRHGYFFKAFQMSLMNLKLTGMKI